MRPHVDAADLAEQLAQLRELEHFLRQALAREQNPAQLARYFELFRDVRDRILEIASR